GDIGRGAPPHHAVADASLLGAVPHGRRAAAVLMVGVHPLAQIGDLLDVDLGPDAAAQVAHVDAVFASLGGCVLPEFPDGQDPLEAPVRPAAEVRVGALRIFRQVRLELRAIRAPAAVAIAHRAQTGAGPAVG